MPSTARATSTLAAGLGARRGALDRLRGRLGVGRLGGFGLRRLRLGVGLGVGLGLRLLVGALLLLGADQVALVFLVGLEVGLVPARALEAEHGCRDQLAQAILAAV